MPTAQKFLRKSLPLLVSATLFATIMHASAADQVVGGGLYDIIVGDFDGDQMSDVIRQGLSGQQQHSAVLAAVQRASIQRWQDGFLDTAWNRDAAHLAVGDFNGDASTDVIVQGNNPLALATVIQTYSDGRLGMPVQTIGSWYLGLQWDAAHHRLITADFNGDGRDDVFLQGTSNKDRHALALANEKGTFDRLAFDFDNNHLNRDWAINSTTLASGDFDGNGSYELFAQPANGQDSAFVISSDSRALLSTIQTTVPAQHLNLDWSSGRHRVVVGDFNGDGKDDVFLLAAHSIEQSAYLPSSGTAFERIDKVIERIPDLEKLKQVLVGDFDADGIDDLILLFTDPDVAPLVLLADAARAARLNNVLRKLGVVSAAQTLRFDEGKTRTGGEEHDSSRTTTATVATNAATSAIQATQPKSTVTAASKTAQKAASYAALPEPTPTEFGSTSGRFRVDERGAATYSIPIATAPGSGGVAPNVSINYSSQGRNGPLGVGWSIGGLSAVTRCRATKETDGFDDEIKFSDKDKFCLDGSRLVEVTSMSTTGNWVYRTEVDSFAKITAVGGSKGTPNYFTVTRKDGSTSYYGNTADSKVELVEGVNSGKVVTWALAKTADSIGNNVRFTYTESGGEHLIANIRSYGNGLSAFQAEVQFVPEPRPDTRTFYAFDAKAVVNKRIKEIVSSSDLGQVRRYKLFYNNTGSNDLSRLEYLQECRLEACLPAMRFTWQNTINYFESNARPDGGADFSHRFVSGRVGDFNGDGNSDLAWLSRDANWNYFWLRIWTKRTTTSGDYIASVPANFPISKSKLKSWHVLDYNGDGRSDVMSVACTKQVDVRVVIDPDTDAAIYVPTCLEWSGWSVLLAKPDGSMPSLPDGQWVMPPGPDVVITGLPSTNSEASDLADFDGNGMPDLLYRDSTLNKTYVSLLETRGVNGHVCQNPAITTGSCFGIPKEVSTNIVSPYPLGADDISAEFIGLAIEGEDRPSVQAMDMNGDSAADLIFETSYKVKYYNCDPRACRQVYKTVSKKRILISRLNSGVMSFDEGVGFTPQLDKIVKSTSDGSQFADINGDGLTDMVYLATGIGWTYAINTGAKFLPGPALAAIPNSERLSVFDINADGLADLFYPESGAYMVRLQQAGGSFSEAIDTLGNAEMDDEHTDFLGDFNGDGRLDKLGLLHDYEGSNHSGQHIQMFADSGQASGVIKEFRQPAGAITRIEYAPLTNANVYSKGTPLTRTSGRGSPVFDVLAPIYVVSRASSSAPTAGATPQAVNQSAMAAVSYRYSGLKMQAGGRGSLGFQSLTTTDEQTGVVTTTTYEQAFPYTGLPKSTTKTTASGTLFSEATNTVKLYSETSGGQQTYLGGDFPLIESTTERVRDINGDITTDFLSKTVTTTGYDRYGNVSTIAVANKAGWSSTADVQTKTTVNLYGNTVDEGFYGRLSQSQVTTTRPSLSPETRTSQFLYNSSNRQLEQEIIEPAGDEKTFLRTVYKFDSFGNRRQTSVCSIHVSNCGTDTTQQPSNAYFINRTATAEYDPQGRFVVKKFNHYGQLLEHLRAWNESYQPTEVVGSTGIVKTLQYTAFGRLWRESDNTGSTGSWSESQMDSCAQVSCISGAAYRIAVTSSGKPNSFQYFDMLGREIATQIDSLTQAATGYLTKYTEYDQLSRVKRVSLPHFSYGSAPGWEQTDYDILGRATRITHANGTTAQIDYLGLKTTRTNEVGQRKVEQRNALGELTSVIDNELGSGVERAVLTYSYDIQGQLAKLYRANSTTALQSELRYDLRGRKTRMWDANKSTSGYWYYDYNAAGELIKQTDARSYTTENRYDNVGRLISRIEKSNTGSELSNASWSYELNAAKAGLLLSDSATVPLGETGLLTTYNRTYSYDGLGRPTGVTHQFEGNSYSESTEYDPVDGRVAAKRDITGKGLRYVYTPSNYLNEVQDADNSSIVFQRIQEMDAFGNITRESMGNGAVTNRSFAPLTGRLSDIVTTRGAQLQNLHYEWSDIGNLTLRRDTSGGKYLEESFGYDGLNRLTRAYAGAPDKEVITSYDAEGNIKTKSDVGADTYQYGGACNGVTAGPHAVTAVGSKTYCYDKNGNMVSGDGRTLSYNNTFDLPTQIVGGSSSTFFSYGIDRARFKRVDRKTGETDSTVWYVGSVEIIKKPDGNTEFRRAIPNGIVTNGNPTYILKDHIGSTDVILDCLGRLVEAHSFDAWGKQRNVDTWKLRGGMWSVAWPGEMLAISPMLSPRTSAKTIHGFTGHEMVDELGLIHMNGRMYDGHLGRFLQADPQIQAPTMSQSLNRYSYVINNPLSGTDPSGFSWWMEHRDRDIRPVVAVVVAIVMTVYCGPGAGASIYEAMAFGAAVGAISGGIASGTVKGAFNGAISGAVFAGIGAAGAQHGWEAGTLVAAHAMAGGVLAELQGGEFGHGFIAAAFTKGTSIGVNSNVVVETIVAAVVSGTISEMTGGKFANGALTGAFQYLLNEYLSRGGSARYHEDTSEPKASSAPASKIRYNAPSPRTVPVTGETLDATERLIENLGLDSALLTGGAEVTGHSRNSLHYTNRAIDVAGPMFNNIDHAEIIVAAERAGFTHGWFEVGQSPGSDHWHFQIGSGNGVPALPVWKDYINNVFDPMSSVRYDQAVLRYIQAVDAARNRPLYDEWR